jgi:Uma2 family endonuclease
MISLAEGIFEAIDRLPSDAVLIQHGVSWVEYEELLETVGEGSGLRISYDEGTLQVMTLSQQHEVYSTLIERIVDRVSSFLRIKALFYGSATMRRQSNMKGAEPDASFYIQNAELVGKKTRFDFEADPPPDVVVEIDLHHDSISKFPIYAGLCVPEFWRYDGNSMTIYQLREEHYVASDASESLPLLTGTVLTEFLARSPQEDQYDILLAFEEWLKGQS